MVSAQSWQGLAADDDERYRIAATADGGIWLMHTPYPEPLVQLAGTRRVLESAHKLIGAAWGEEGTTRAQHAWTADPDLIRTLGTGQACYIHRGRGHLRAGRPAETVPAQPPRGPPRAHGDHPAARAPTGRRPAGAELAGRLDELPERIQAALFAAFDIQILWNPPMRQATIYATMTDTTPGIITDLLTRASDDDPATTATRTDTTTAEFSDLARLPIPRKVATSPYLAARGPVMWVGG